MTAGLACECGDDGASNGLGDSARWWSLSTSRLAVAGQSQSSNKVSLRHRTGQDFSRDAVEHHLGLSEHRECAVFVDDAPAEVADPSAGSAPDAGPVHVGTGSPPVTAQSRTPSRSSPGTTSSRSPGWPFGLTPT